VVSRGVAAGAGAVTKRLPHPLRCSAISELDARSVSLRGTAFRRASISLSVERSHKCQVGVVMGLGLATQAFRKGLGLLLLYFMVKFGPDLLVTCQHASVQAALESNAARFHCFAPSPFAC
jgi:hypothetical protein